MLFDSLKGLKDADAERWGGHVTCVSGENGLVGITTGVTQPRWLSSVLPATLQWLYMPVLRDESSLHFINSTTVGLLCLSVNHTKTDRWVHVLFIPLYDR